MTTPRSDGATVFRTDEAIAHIESWPVIVQAGGGAVTTADSIVQIRASGVRLVASGEGASRLMPSRTDRRER